MATTDTQQSTEQQDKFISMLNRRRMLQTVGLATAGSAWAKGRGADAVWGADPVPLDRFPRMVQEYYVHLVREADRRNVAAYRNLKTKADAEKYVASVRDRIRTSFGPEPERTPLNARITGVVQRDTYRIEKLIFESRPGFPVTANLYIPNDVKSPRPAVVGTCGHSNNGKAAEAYQSFSQGLARLGYVCLIYDPISQGERLQYVKDDLTSRYRPGVREHIQEGNQQFLVGEFIGMWRAWDGIRALDYLLTRKEVDPHHVGVTGNSGGGTMTTWLCGVEPRWTMAAPSCFVTTFRRNMENELPADTEQCPPRAMALGLDHCDFIAAMAPKPVLLLGKERDFFDVRGIEEAYGRLKHLYRLLGHPDNIGLYYGPTTHGYSQENREAMYRWFNRATKISDAKSEPELTIEEDETLWCTPKGQVAAMPDTKTVFTFTRDKSQQLTKQRPSLRGAALTRKVKRVLRLSGSPQQPPDFRILRAQSAKGYPLPHAIAYAVETEPGILALVYMLSKEREYSRPPRDGKRAILYVAHRSSDTELRAEPMIRDAVKADPESRVFSCDVRGIGDSLPNTCGNNTFNDPYGCDFFYSIHGLMLDRPYLGQKTFDILRVLDWLESYGYTEVHLLAKGWGALAGTFAALLDKRIRRVTLKNALTSYAEVAETEDYRWPLAALLPNVLAHFDLPDCYRELEAKQLQQIEPWGPVDGLTR